MIVEKTALLDYYCLKITAEEYRDLSKMAALHEMGVDELLGISVSAGYSGVVKPMYMNFPPTPPDPAIVSVEVENDFGEGE